VTISNSQPYRYAETREEEGAEKDELEKERKKEGGRCIVLLSFSSISVTSLALSFSLSLSLSCGLDLSSLCHL
jgi:hypothetical protein